MRAQAHSSLLLGMIAVVLFLNGCTRGTDDLRTWVADEKAKKGAPLERLPVIKTFETFEYRDQELRDPFSPSAQDLAEEQQTANAGQHPDRNRPKEPLESFSLDTLKMVGTIGTGPGLEGLIKDPDNVIHRVHLNNYMGQNDGKITNISEDHLDLMELVPNGTGGWMPKPAAIALGDK